MGMPVTPSTGMEKTLEEIWPKIGTLAAVLGKVDSHAGAPAMARQGTARFAARVRLAETMHRTWLGEAALRACRRCRTDQSHIGR